jgi:glycerol-3-phosphate acyltransferase PlsY
VLRDTSGANGGSSAECILAREMMRMTAVLVWTGLGYLLGSLPFSVWVVSLILKTDIRRYGDGNPGAANAFRAGGWRTGVPASLLDYFKGVLPVGLAHFTFGISGFSLVPVALAPVLGHAFSPFLNFRGGKALAATFGIWTGLTLGEGPTMIGIFVALFTLVQTNDALSVVLAMFGWLAHLLIRGTDTATVTIWSGNLLILVWKHRHDFRGRIQPRSYILHFLRKW